MLAPSTRRHPTPESPVMATLPLPPPEDVLTSLPAKLSADLFAKSRPVSLAVDQSLFLPGDPSATGLMKVPSK
jgi:hypothetical protein